MQGDFQRASPTHHITMRLESPSSDCGKVAFDHAGLFQDFFERYCDVEHSDIVVIGFIDGFLPACGCDR